MLDGVFRGPVDRAVRPIGRALRRTGLSPDHLTIVGLVVGALAAVAVATGRLILGLVLVIAAALPDLFDGALAKASGTSSQRGAFFDSTVDRITDAMLLGGIAWYLADVSSPHAAILPFAVSSVASVISYQRAKAESLGLDAKGGLMERAERIVTIDQLRLHRGAPAGAIGTYAGHQAPGLSLVQRRRDVRRRDPRYPAALDISEAEVGAEHTIGQNQGLRRRVPSLYVTAGIGLGVPLLLGVRQRRLVTDALLHLRQDVVAGAVDDGHQAFHFVGAVR